MGSCAECGTSHTSSDLYTTVTDASVCRDCILSYQGCESCGDDVGLAVFCRGCASHDECIPADEGHYYDDCGPSVECVDCWDSAEYCWSHAKVCSVKDCGAGGEPYCDSHRKSQIPDLNIEEDGSIVIDDIRVVFS